MNGAVYALLGVALVLLFTVTRVIFVAQGEFVAWGALTMAALRTGPCPARRSCSSASASPRRSSRFLRARGRLAARRYALIAARDVAYPLLALALAAALAPQKLGLAVEVALTLALIVPMGPLVYRLAFQPLADASVLILFIAAIGVHLAMTGLGLAVFGAEGSRTRPDARGRGSGRADRRQDAEPRGARGDRGGDGGPVRILRADARSARRCARPRSTGSAPGSSACASTRTARTAFALAAGIGALSGVLIGPLTTVAYDTGFLIGLKGFVAAIIAGLVELSADRARRARDRPARILLGLLRQRLQGSRSSSRSSSRSCSGAPTPHGAPADEEEE